MVDDCYTNTDIADFFTHKYQHLYTSVPFTVIDIDEIRSDLSASIQVISGECIFSSNDVLTAVDKLELHKAAAVKDYFHITKKPGHDLYVHVAFLLSGILVHGYIPDGVSVGAIIPVPIGNNSNVTDSIDYKRIALSSIICNLCVLIVLDLCSNKLITSDLQHGLKRNGLLISAA